MSTLQTFHIAIYAMIVACLIPIILAATAKILGGFTTKDNADPRTFLANTKGAAQRANAAQANSFEILPLFIASVLTAMFFVVPQFVINKLAMLFILFRVLYAIAYIANVPSLRTSLWLLSAACPMLLFWFVLKIN